MRDPTRPSLLIAVVVAACGGGSIGPSADAAGSGTDASAACPVACDDGEVCRHGQCVPTPAPCAALADCAGDTYCDLPAGECIPWGVGPGGNQDPTCTREVVAGVFFPGAQCEWLGPPAGDPYPDHRNILGSPMVADFGVSGDPELGRPSIVFISYNGTDGGSPSCVGTDPALTGVIRVLDGRSCEQQASIATPLPIASTALALGDLTGDGVAEIVAARVGGGLAAWRLAPGGGFEMHFDAPSAVGAGACDWAGPQLHDLDDDGVPEILLYGAVFDAGGQLISEDVTGLTGGAGYIPVVADLDRDGQPELVTGAGTWGWDPVTSHFLPEATLGEGPGQTAVADLGTYGLDPLADDRATRDGIGEVVVIRSSRAYVYRATGGAPIFDQPLPGGGTGGAPTIADFDGDGRAELASAGAAAYTVFDPDCLGTPSADTCPTLRTDGVLWSRQSQDGSSNQTGSSVFDFEGDGVAEAVYGDECFTRVYDGRSGDVVYSRYRTSCTWYENPIIADVDADFAAEIVITSNTNCAIACPEMDPIFDGVRCFDESDCPGATTCGRDAAGDPLGRCRCAIDDDCGGDGFVCRDPIAGASAAGKVCRAHHPGPATAFGLRVVGDQLDRWVGTRTIWNQHAYSVTNVEDSGRIPRTSDWLRNWDVAGLNNFRQNSPGEGAGAGLMPDLTVRGAEAVCGAGGAVDVTVEVCDRGTEPVADGVSIAVYGEGDALLCTAVTTRVLRPGQCQEVTCSFAGGGAPVSLGIFVDDDGSGAGDHTECREGNNKIVLAGVACP